MVKLVTSIQGRVNTEVESELSHLNIAKFMVYESFRSQGKLEGRGRWIKREREREREGERDS